MRTLSKFELKILKAICDNAMAKIVAKPPISEKQEQQKAGLQRLLNCFEPGVRNSMSEPEWQERLWRCANHSIMKKDGKSFIEWTFEEVLAGMSKHLG